MTSRVRQADVEDVGTLAALRRAWTEEDGPLADETFEQRFADWYVREAPRRVTWIAEVDGFPVGLLSLALLERMPRPDRPRATWGYLANLFVLEAYRGRGLGGQLLQAMVEYSDAAGLDRLVGRPSEGAESLYRRHGFGPADILVLRHFGPVYQR